MGENNHRGTRACQIDGRRCSEPKCKKVAKDLIDGKYLCRIHSPTRKGFAERLKIEKKKEKNKK